MAGTAKLRDDPTLKIPEAVLRQSAAASDTHKQAYNSETPAEPPVVEPSSGILPAEPVAPAPAAPAAPAPAAQVPDTGAGDTYENRFRAEQGRVRAAEIREAALQNQIGSMQTQLANMQELLSRMNTQPPAPTPAPELAAASLITPEDRQTYGDDFMEMVQRAARASFAEERTAFQNEIASLKAQITGVTTHVAQDARQKMITELTAALPEWRTQNQDPKFLAWLRLPDAFSGVIRSELLSDAWAANQTHRVVSIFKGFLTEEATVAPATPTAPASDGRPSLEDLAAPGRAKSEATPPGGPSAKPRISRAQITQFYTDVRAGRYAGRDEEKNRTEAEIFAAQSEGRID